MAWMTLRWVATSGTGKSTGLMFADGLTQFRGRAPCWATITISPPDDSLNSTSSSWVKRRDR